MCPGVFSESAYGDLDINKTYQYKAFGVPGLGLKRGLEEEVVVAPYAALLAVNVAPGETVRNLSRLAGLGLLGDYGYYEAMDFSRQPSSRGERGVIVQAYMAHHQGMGFLSLTNFLHGNSIQRRFHADARVRAVEPLLHERVPVLPPLHHISTRERVPSAESVGEVAPSVSKFDTPHTSTPKTQMLCNGRYGLMVTNAGGGYSQWGDREITRWRSDRTGIRGEPSATSARPIRIGCGPTPITRSAERSRRIPPLSPWTAPCSGAPTTAFTPKPRSSSRRKMTSRSGGSL